MVRLYKNDSSGKLLAIYAYENGRKNGTFKRFYASGEFYVTGTYRNDTLVAYVYHFRENGDSLIINYTHNGKEDFPSKKWLDNGQIFYATYLDSSHSKALYRWTNSSGKELRKEIVSPKKGGKWITSDGNWTTPN